MKILICDDEYATRLLVKSHLDMLGIEAVEASSGKEAVEILQDEKFDAMLIDYSMPDMTGLEVIKEVGDKPPAIVLTSEGFSKDTEEELKQLTVGYLVKPVTKEILRDQLSEIFGEDIFKN